MGKEKHDEKGSEVARTIIKTFDFELIFDILSPCDLSDMIPSVLELSLDLGTLWFSGLESACACSGDSSSGGDGDNIGDDGSGSGGDGGNIGDDGGGSGAIRRFTMCWWRSI